ncbi:MAG: hypothetical protein KF878_25280 [Planctomycetes bacterium]|nr:hypothetical protein [Planctomycetota bacterium]
MRALLREARRGAALARLEHEKGGLVVGHFVGDDARQVVTGGEDGTLRLWREEGGGWTQAARWAAAGKVQRLARDAGRRRVVAATSEGPLLWLDPLEPDARPHAAVILPDLTALGLSADGALACAAPREPLRGPHRVRLVDLRARRLGEELGGTRSPVKAVAVTRGGLLLTCSGEPFDVGRGQGEVEHTLIAWDLATGAERWRLALVTEVTCLALAPDERLVAAGTTSGQVFLVPIEGPEGARELVSAAVGRDLGPFRRAMAHGDGVKGLAFSGDGARLCSVARRSAGEDRGELRLWSVDDGRELRPAVACPLPTSLDLSPAGDVALLGTHLGRVELWAADPD